MQVTPVAPAVYPNRNDVIPHRLVHNLWESGDVFGDKPTGPAYPQVSQPSENVVTHRANVLGRARLVSYNVGARGSRVSDHAE